MSLLAQSVVLTGRNVTRLRRNPASLVSAIVIPVVFFLGFYCVLDQLLATVGLDFATYATPTILVQAMFFAALSSGVFLAQDVTGGMLQRARSLPIARSAPILGRLGADLVRGVISLTVLLVVAAAFGFRFRAGAAAAVAFVGLALLFLAALVAGCGAVALSARSPEAAVQTLFLPYLPLLMLSTGFVPAEQFPGWLQAFVRYQPVSETVEGLRALSAGGPTAGPVLVALLWLLGLLAGFTVLAARAYRTRT